MKHWMLLGAVLASGSLGLTLLGQNTPLVPADPPPPPLIPATDPTPPPTTPEKKATTKKTPTKPAAKTPAPTKPGAKPATATPAPAASARGDLKPGFAVVVRTTTNVNVRGQAAINSEIVTHLKRGDVVTVIKTITKNVGPDEPSKWAMISLPTGATVWTHASFVDASTKAVKPNRLNVRSGPGENYSILGRIDKGTIVHELERKGEWIKIEAPTNAYAFAAAHLLTQESAMLAAAFARTAASPSATKVSTPPPPKTRPVETVEVRPPTVVAPTSDPAPVVTSAPPPTPPPTTTGVVGAGGTTTPPPEPPPLAGSGAPAPIQMADAEPLVRRIVTREGIVRGSASIQAPTYFVLRSLDNNRTINYLLSVDTNIVLRSFQHQRVIVVGEEVLDERWPNTPVIDVEKIEPVQ